MSLADRQLADWVEALRAEPGRPNSEVGADALAAASDERTAARPRGPQMARVDSFTVAGDPGVPVRFYQPVAEPGPLVVYVHGDGWTIGDLDSHDRICRRMAAAAGVGVLAVDFRRAPEHPWPAAVDDTVTVLRWAFDHAADLVGTDVVAVGGDSSGGNLATLACLRLRGGGERLPAAQLLAYPNTDLTFAQPSVVEMATGWGLDAANAIWFAEQWVPDPALRADGRVSPLLETKLDGLPPVLVVTANTIRCVTRVRPTRRG